MICPICGAAMIGDGTALHCVACHPNPNYSSTFEFTPQEQEEMDRILNMSSSLRIKELERELSEAKQRIIQLEIDLKEARHQHQQETDEHEFNHIEITHTPPNGEWIDEMGSCRVCGGEIPHGHSDNCDYYKAATERTAWRKCARLLATALASPQMIDVLRQYQSLQTKYPTE